MFKWQHAPVESSMETQLKDWTRQLFHSSNNFTVTPLFSALLLQKTKIQKHVFPGGNDAGVQEYEGKVGGASAGTVGLVSKCQITPLILFFRPSLPPPGRPVCVSLSLYGSHGCHASPLPPLNQQTRSLLTLLFPPPPHPPLIIWDHMMQGKQKKKQTPTEPCSLTAERHRSDITHT